MTEVHDKTIEEIIELSRLLGEFGQIKRVVLLPNGDRESDSHHSFSLALIAYELARQFAPELNLQKIMLYALVHDLPELITGDVNTLLSSSSELQQKATSDAHALQEIQVKFAAAPHVVEAIKQYERMADDEALFIYWLDKMTTIPTHFYDNGQNLHALGIRNQRDIRQWYQRTLTKLQKQKRTPHPTAATILEMAYKKMHDELLDA